VHGTRGITPDTALRLARAFDVSDRFWLNLQNRFDIETELEKIGAQLAKIEPLKAVLAN
jgi:addiction module HigA family antidote